jgi:hypothetical protein
MVCFGQLGHFLENFSSFLLALFRIGLGCLTPAEKCRLGCPHMAGDLFTQRTCRAGKRLYGLVKNPHIVGVADVRLKGSRIDPNPPWLDRSSFQQLLDQMFIETADSILAKSLIELDQGGRI